MAGTGRVALGRVVMTGRERTVAIEVRGRGLLLTTLRAAEAVRADAEAFAAVPDLSPDPQMVEIARSIMARQDGPFEPSAFHDRYAEALRSLVESKAAEAIPAPDAPAADTNVIDLMDALRRSLGPAEPKVKARPAKKPASKRREPRRA